MKDNEIFTINTDIVSNKDSEGVNILVRLDESDDFYRIDGLASTIWDMLKDQKPLGVIHQELAERYPLKTKELGQDIETFVKELMTLDIIRKKNV